MLYLNANLETMVFMYLEVELNQLHEKIRNQLLDLRHCTDSQKSKELCFFSFTIQYNS